MNNRIVLGYPLDLLLDRECKFENYYKHINEKFSSFATEIKRNRDCGQIGSIRLPEKNNPGSGNIIIRGKPGTAKSTLALQIAVSAAQEGNDSISFYITLEESPENVRNKSELFGWDSKCKIFEQQCDIEAKASCQEYKNYLNNFINKKTKPCVYISTLTPRDVFDQDANENSLYWDRYEQLENLLKSANGYNEDTDNKYKIGFVCIDSINVFGDDLLSRKELFRIFNLFRRYGIIGIIIVEEDERYIYQSNGKLHGETIEFVGDIIISLTLEEDQNYMFRYLEITKSRYQHQVYGKHPFKTEGKKSDPEEAVFALRVYPSLHYIVFGKESKNKSGELKIDKGTLFFAKDVEEYLASNFKAPGSILIEGPAATFKTNIAKDFLFRGLLNDDQNTRKNLVGLDAICRVNKYHKHHKHHKHKITNRNEKHIIFIQFSDDNYAYREQSENQIQFIYSGELNSYLEGKGITCQKKMLNNIEDNYRYVINKYLVNSNLKIDNKIKILEGYYTEVIFKSGNILPEEFVNALLKVFVENDIAPDENIRIVFDEIGKIGTAYPFLLKNKTSGELFISSILHILKNYQATVIITGTTGNFEKADKVIDHVRTSVDATLSTRKVSVFGDNYIILKGEGLLKHEHEVAEKTPAVILHSSDTTYNNGRNYRVDKDYFNGLVGFENNKIYRPGVTFYTYEENSSIYKKYNESLSPIFEFAFNYRKPIEIAANVLPNDTGVIAFDGGSSEAYHNALSLTSGNPLDRTILFTIDEFYKGNKEEGTKSEGNESDKTFLELEKKSIYDEKYLIANKHGSSSSTTFPYYDNVLFIAYNNELLGDDANELSKKSTVESWKEIKSIIDKCKKDENNTAQPIGMCLKTNQTIACVFIDVLIKYIKNYKNKKDDVVLGLFPKIIEKKELEFVNEIIAFGKVFSPFMEKNVVIKEAGTTIPKGGQTDSGSSTNRGDNKKRELEYKTQLDTNTLFYVCWYSELRELLKREPDLADKLDVVALPGGGFKGDWQVGMLKGSVSSKLGINIIKTLCSKTEDYKRFFLGVGMPTNERFRNKNSYSAWPNSDINIKLKKQEIIKTEGVEKAKKIRSQLDYLYYIHEHANERSKIKDYRQNKDVFMSLFNELMNIIDEDEKTLQKHIVKKIIVPLKNSLRNMDGKPNTNAKN